MSRRSGIGDRFNDLRSRGVFLSSYWTSVVFLPLPLLAGVDLSVCLKSSFMYSSPASAQSETLGELGPFIVCTLQPV